MPLITYPLNHSTSLNIELETSRLFSYNFY